MTPDVVVDIGNSRVKWGRCVGGRVTDRVSLAPDDSTDWDRAGSNWGVSNRGERWVVASVHPARRDRFLGWLGRHGVTVTVIADQLAVPVPMKVDEPAKVGMDRLMNALAAMRAAGPGVATITADIGTAITLDLTDTSGAFVGGAIMPGPRLMAASLRDYTAALPLVDISPLLGGLPFGANTVDAIRAGIAALTVGGIREAVEDYAPRLGGDPHVFVTGGGREYANRLAELLRFPVTVDPFHTLEGIRLAAEALP